VFVAGHHVLLIITCADRMRNSTPRSGDKQATSAKTNKTLRTPGNSGALEVLFIFADEEGREHCIGLMNAWCVKCIEKQGSKMREEERHDQAQMSTTARCLQSPYVSWKRARR